MEVEGSTPDIEAPGPVRDLTAVAVGDEVTFTWENPDTKDEDQNEVPRRDRDYKGVLVIRQAGARPLDIPIRDVRYEAGGLIGDSEVVFSGGEEGFAESGLVLGETYFYALFPYDEVPNYGEPQFLDATPGSSIKARFGHTATALNDGRILVVGGVGYGGAQDTAELYDPDAGAFTDLEARMRTPRFGHAAVALDDGRILITGGYREGFTESLRSATIFDPATLRFEAVPESMSEVRALHTSTLLPDGTVIILGGSDGDLTLDSGEIFDPATGSFTILENAMAGARASHTATLVEGEGVVLLAGGYDGERAIDGVALYHPDTGEFTDLGGVAGRESSLAVARLSHTAAVLDGGDVMLCGGFSGNSTTGEPTATCERFVPEAGGGWLEDGPEMIEARTGHASVRLVGGDVLYLGGIDGELQVLDSAELYEVDQDGFVAVGSLVRGRTVPRAVLLIDGTVAVLGGNASGNVFDPWPVSLAESFDPETLAFSVLSGP